MSRGISGVVLAGGQGRRMGGVDKGLQVLGDKPMVAWVIERLAPQVDELLINANQNAEIYGRYGVPVFPDRVAGFAGPLAGLHAALAQAAHPLVVTAPCDSPFLPSDLVERLHAGFVAERADLAVARAGDQDHPVFCLCRRDLLGHLGDFLDGGGRKVDRWYARLKVATVSFADEAAFSNINTVEELARHGRSSP